jgi:glutathione synthase/RimK-type ligase-like ATP-grasp enzyme
MKYSVAILRNELEADHHVWQESLTKNERIAHVDVINLTSDNWLSDIKKRKYNAFILKPSGLFSHFKQLYDERVILISEIFDTLVYPSLKELLIYENKRYLRDWLMARNLPHPKTHVFYKKSEVINFINQNRNYPLVGKTNIGAAGSGVKILQNHEAIMKYVEDAFGKGIYLKSGPKLRKGSLMKKIRKIFTGKGHFSSKMQQYRDFLSTPQRGFVIVQEFIPHSFEWRCVRIGDSYFAHKKLAKNNKSSGTLLKDYSQVPLKLLDFVREITDKNDLTSVAIDIFEHDKQYLINEIQCIFGQSDPYQMLVNDVPGRYKWAGNEWKFEEGMFNTNCSYDLRVAHLIELLDVRSIKNNSDTD